MAELVRVEGLCKYYGSEKQRVLALDHIEFRVDKGDFLALCGPSGSGKTTLLNILGALDRFDQGEVYVQGQALSQMDFDQLTQLRRNTIGFVFQSYNLIPVMTVLENASFVLNLQKVRRQEQLERAREALALLGLEGFEDRFPHQLSGGQQQRVAVARAVAARPALLLADEPTANLDSKSARELLDFMERLNTQHGVSFVFSTHDPRIMERAHRLIPMKDGRIEAQAGHEVRPHG